MALPLAALALPVLGTAARAAAPHVGRFLMQRAIVPAGRWIGQRGASWLATHGGRAAPWIMGRVGGKKGIALAVAFTGLKRGAVLGLKGAAFALKLGAKGLGALGGALPGGGLASTLVGAAGAALGNAAGLLGALASAFEQGASGQSYGMGSSLTPHQQKFRLAA
ncbi:hypothetical protein ACIBFB_07080 [Nocardiopsis sp. NPDC050513]|uniref:hypothetical protein n=1 Tax=Nocardiopsis sp. NPDC050513 TaxID=3364338 RepID=UPI00378C87DC